jgi:lipopolysaccharide export LptBFGC system permease protein LptF|tara:strand:- start:535 stop:882 length:348 start_codon:yes stop_codon:yes gene_type:complete
MNEVLNKIAEIIEDYNNTTISDGVKLNEQLKNLTSYLYYIEGIKSKYHQDYEEIVYNKVNNEKLSVARAVNIANVEVPEVYKLRKLTSAGYRVCDAIRSNISFLKLDYNNVTKNY